MILELRDICKTYDQGKLEVPVLKNVSLSVEEGEYLAIMGPSGSGKTTLMNIIGCLDVPTSGEYILEGENLSGQSDAMLSQTRLRSIGFVFQSFYLLSRQSAAENVALPLLYAGVKKKERMELAQRALERVGLGDRLDFKPTQLSGGQCQRVAIARAMVNNPKILLADEPTGALDTASGEQIMELFEKLHREGVTIVMITHEPSIAAHAQRILHIRDGQLVDAPAPAVLPAAAQPAPAPAIPVPAEDPVRLEEGFVDEPSAEEIAAFAGIESDAAAVPETEEPAAEQSDAELDIEDLPLFEEPAKPEAAPVQERETAAVQPETKAMPAAPVLAEPLTVRRQAPKLTPIQVEGLFKRPAAVETPIPAEEPEKPSRAAELPVPEEPERVLEIEDIVIEELEEPEQPADFAQQLKEMAVLPEPEETVLPQETIPAAEEEPVEEPAVPEEAPREPEVPIAEIDETVEADLNAEVSALLDQGEATANAYASGDMFLHDATAKAPELIARPTKIGAPDQITFDVWAEPEELDMEAEAFESAITMEEPEPEEDPEASPQLALEPELPEAESAPIDEELPATEGTAEKDEPIEIDFDTAFDAVDPYEPEETPTPSGEFGAPRKTEVDLSSAFAKKEPSQAAPPWGNAAPSGRPRLIEIEDLTGLEGIPSQGGDAQ